MQLTRPGNTVPISCAALALCVLMSACGAGSHHAAGPSTTPRYSNPVFARDFPDPMVLRLGRHDYYAYGTSTTWERTGAYFPVLHSTDAIHWTYVADAIRSQPAWANNDFWAPDVVQRGNTFYLYYVGTSDTVNVHCIGMATSTSPRGPFTTRTTFCGDRNGFGLIDPDLFIDRDGKACLYVSADGPPHTINVIPMRPDLLHPAGISRVLFGVTQGWETGPQFSTVEGPFMLRHGALYYLFYSGNSYEGDYAMGYATSASPTGPFRKYAGNPVLRGNTHVHGPGGGSVFEGPDGRLWMAYHARVGQPGADIRNLRIDPLVWRGAVAHVSVHPG